MTPERYQRLRGLFAQVMEAPPDQRSILQKQFAQSHPDLYADLEVLLSLSDASSSRWRLDDEVFQAAFAAQSAHIWPIEADH